jgi:hypothetical protein
MRGVEPSGGRRRRTTPLSVAEEQRLQQYREQGTVQAVLRRTSPRFKAWTLAGFLALLAVTAFLLWWAVVPDIDLAVRGTCIALAAVYWPAIGAWAVRRNRPQLDRVVAPRAARTER